MCSRLRVLMMLDLELADLLCVSLAFLPQLLIMDGDFLLVCRRQVGHFRFGVQILVRFGNEDPGSTEFPRAFQQAALRTLINAELPVGEGGR